MSLGAVARTSAGHLKTLVLTAIVVASFLLSSLAWRRVDSSETERILVAAAILIGMYVLMIFELVNRNLAALIGAAAAVAAHACLVDFVDLPQLVRWLDLETLALLLGMMIMVNVLASSNVFDFLAVWCYQRAAGRFWALVFVLAIITCLLSAFVDNVSTMLLMAPTLIKLAELERLDPRPLLIIMVIFSNIGGCATPVGDPPNLIIIGDPLVSALHITFGSFVAYAAPCVLLTLPLIMLYLKLHYKSKASFRLAEATSGQTSHQRDSLASCSSRSNSLGSAGSAQKEECGRQLTQDVEAGRALVVLELARKLKAALQSGGRAASGRGADELELAGELQQRIGQLESRLETNHEVLSERQQLKRNLKLELEMVARNGARGSRLDEAQIAELRQSHCVRSRPLLAVSLAVLLVTILLFFVQSLPGSNLTLGWISLFAGLTLLVASSSIKLEGGGGGEQDDERDSSEQDDEQEAPDNFERVVGAIEWSTLMFFAALFVAMEVMAKLGLLQFVGAQISNSVGLLPSGPLRTAGAITIVLWASGVSSALVDNVPFTSMMIKVLGSMALSASESANESGSAPLPLKPLVFALAFGACLGGNGSLIGASANLITANLAARHRYPITFNAFFRFAAPIALITLITANLYLVLVFVVLGL